MTRFEDVLAALPASASGGFDKIDAPRAVPDDPEPGAVHSRCADPVARRLLGLLGPSPVAPGALASAVGLDIALVLAALGELEVAGLASHTARGFMATPYDSCAIGTDAAHRR